VSLLARPPANRGPSVGGYEVWIRVTKKMARPTPSSIAG